MHVIFIFARYLCYISLFLYFPNFQDSSRFFLFHVHVHQVHCAHFTCCLNVSRPLLIWFSLQLPSVKIKWMTNSERCAQVCLYCNLHETFELRLRNVCPLYTYFGNNLMRANIKRRNWKKNEFCNEFWTGKIEKSRKEEKCWRMRLIWFVIKD